MFIVMAGEYHIMALELLAEERVQTGVDESSLYIGYGFGASGHHHLVDTYHLFFVMDIRAPFQKSTTRVSDCFHQCQIQIPALAQPSKCRQCFE